MLDEEGHVKSNDHEPERPFTEPLREHAAAHFRKPILQATDDCEDDRAYRHKVKMCDEKVAVLSLPIECHAGMTDFGDDCKCGKGHDVDFRMAKGPKNVLPQNGRTSANR